MNYYSYFESISFDFKTKLYIGVLINPINNIQKITGTNLIEIEQKIEKLLKRNV